MFKRIYTSSHSQNEFYEGRHRFEHWYVDNQVYFITARCRRGGRAFASDHAKSIFWDRFDHYTQDAGFIPWVTSLVDNHYHTLGYMRQGLRLGKMMQRIHGSVAKLVNDTLPRRLKPFWRDELYGGGRDYYDGCIRDVKQCTRAYRYILRQSARHRLATDYRTYPHTRVNVPMDEAIAGALELHAFMEQMKYPRYDRRR